MSCVQDCRSIICKVVRRRTKFCFKKPAYKIILVSESTNYILELIITLFRLIMFGIALVQAQVEAKKKKKSPKGKIKNKLSSVDGIGMSIVSLIFVEK